MFRNYKEIYFTEAREFDIFRIYEQPGRLYCNQYFIDFCQQSNITNILEKYGNTLACLRFFRANKACDRERGKDTMPQRRRAEGKSRDSKRSRVF